jgi:hypothetical protein
MGLFLGIRLALFPLIDIAESVLFHPDPEWTGAPGEYVAAKGSFSTIGVDDYETDHRLAFDRWLEKIKAETSFVGGVVAVGEEAKDLRSVLVAVTPEDFVFFDEGGAGDAEMPELGRFPRSSVKMVDVLDESGMHVPGPNIDSIDERPMRSPPSPWTGSRRARSSIGTSSCSARHRSHGMRRTASARSPSRRSWARLA